MSLATNSKTKTKSLEDYKSELKHLSPNGEEFQICCYNLGAALADTNKSEESLHYFEQIDWTPQHYTEEAKFKELSVYIDALCDCNHFYHCKKILGQIKTDNLSHDQTECVYNWNNLVNRFIYENDKIGSLYDDGDQTVCVKKWLNDESIDVTTLLRYTKLFDVKFDDILNAIPQSTESTNTNDNTNQSNDPNGTIAIKQQELTDLFKQAKQLCNKVGISDETLKRQCFGNRSNSSNNKNKNNNSNKNNKSNKNNNSNNNDSTNKSEFIEYDRELHKWMENAEQLRNISNHGRIENKMNDCEKVMALVQKNEAILENDWRRKFIEIVNMTLKLSTQLQSLNNAESEEKRKNFVLGALLDQALLKLESCKQIKHESDIQLKNLQNDVQIFAKRLGMYKTMKQKYSDFNQMHFKHALKLKQAYKTYWDEKEPLWYNWNISQIVDWFKYQISLKNQNKDDTNVNTSNQNNNSKRFINYDEISNNLELKQYKSSYLAAITIDDLKEFGFTSETNEYPKIQHLLYNAIRNMCKKYPMPKYNIFCNNINNNNNTGNNSINNKYLCPISNEIMKYPVIAYNNQSYEKQNIIDYWRKYGKCPNSDETVVNVEDAIKLLEDDKMLKREIDIWSNDVAISSNNQVGTANLMNCNKRRYNYYDNFLFRDNGQNGDDSPPHKKQKMTTQ